MSNRPATTTTKSAKDRMIAGRSAATGRYVLMPASKGSSISVKDASRAAKNAQVRDEPKFK